MYIDRKFFRDSAGRCARFELCISCPAMTSCTEAYLCGDGRPVTVNTMTIVPQSSKPCVPGNRDACGASTWERWRVKSSAFSRVGTHLAEDGAAEYYTAQLSTRCRVLRRTSGRASIVRGQADSIADANAPRLALVSTGTQAALPARACSSWRPGLTQQLRPSLFRGAYLGRWPKPYSQISH